jgi:hypothetical protein
MTVEYELTESDLNAFNRYHHFHSPTARRQYLRSWIAPALIMFVIWLVIWHLADRERGTPVQTFLDLLPLLSGVPIYLVLFPWWYRRKVSQIISGMIGEGKNRGLLGRHQVSVSPDGINESGEPVSHSRTGEQLNAWPGTRNTRLFTSTHWRQSSSLRGYSKTLPSSRGLLAPQLITMHKQSEMSRDWDYCFSSTKQSDDYSFSIR